MSFRGLIICERKEEAILHRSMRDAVNDSIFIRFDFRSNRRTRLSESSDEKICEILARGWIDYSIRNKSYRGSGCICKFHDEII